MGKRTIVVVLLLAAVLGVMTLWLARAPQPVPVLAPTVATRDAPTTPTTSPSSARERGDAATANHAAGDSDLDAADDEPRIASTILTNILLRDFFAEVGIAVRDVELFRRLLDDPTSATFDALIERSERGDPQASVLLNTLNKELCTAFRGLTDQANWKDETRARFDQQSYEFKRVLAPRDLRRFELVTGEFLNLADRVSAQCRRGHDAMIAARERLPQLADEGDTVALMALAATNDTRRESLISMLHELPNDQLVTASDVIGRSAQGCDAFEVRLGVLRERAAASPAVSAALGRLYTSSCMDARVDPEEGLAHWRAGAYLGSTDNADAYLAALATIDPGEQRIEAFAIQSFFAQLNRLGCMGGNYFDILRQQNTERALTRGLHLSPYENDVALARAQTLWKEHGQTAMAHHHCRS